MEVAKEDLKMGLSNAPIGIFILDKKGIFTYANPAFLKIVGYKEKYIVSKTYQEIVNKIAPPETTKILKERIKHQTFHLGCSLSENMIYKISLFIYMN